MAVAVAVQSCSVCAEAFDKGSVEAVAVAVEVEADCFISPSIASSRELFPAPTGPAMSNSSPRLTERLTSLNTGAGSGQGIHADEEEEGEEEVEEEGAAVEPLSG